MVSVPGMRPRAGRGVVATVAALTITFVSSLATGDCRREAAALYDAARAEFDGGRFDASVPLLQRAYACDPNPVYLGNIARAYEEAHRPRDAIAAWRRWWRCVTSAASATPRSPKRSTSASARCGATGKRRDCSWPPRCSLEAAMDLARLQDAWPELSALLDEALGLPEAERGAWLAALSWCSRSSRTMAETAENASGSSSRRA